MPAKNISINVPGKGNFFVINISNAKIASPKIMDHEPIDKPNVLLSQYVVHPMSPHQSWPLIVNVIPKESTIMPVMKNKQRVKSLFHFNPHSFENSCCPSSYYNNRFSICPKIVISHFSKRRLAFRRGQNRYVDERMGYNDFCT